MRWYGYTIGMLLLFTVAGWALRPDEYAEAGHRGSRRGDGPAADTRIVYEAEDEFVDNWDATAALAGQRFGLFFSEIDWLRGQAAFLRAIGPRGADELRLLLEERDKALFIAYLGEASTGGYGVRILQVNVSTPGGNAKAGVKPKGKCNIESKSKAMSESESLPVVTVIVGRRKPDVGDFVIQAFTNPHDVVAVTVADLPSAPYWVRFVGGDGAVLQAYRVESAGDLFIARPSTEAPQPP